VRLGLSERARDDLARIWDFNLHLSERWAEKVQLRLIEVAMGLLVAPRRGRQITKAGIRRLSVPDIQYVIDYQPFDDLITVVRIRSTREVR
jgi:plasmid stabilization system protein ParE